MKKGATTRLALCAAAAVMLCSGCEKPAPLPSIAPAHGQQGTRTTQSEPEQTLQGDIPLYIMTEKDLYRCVESTVEPEDEGYQERKDGLGAHLGEIRRQVDELAVPDLPFSSNGAAVGSQLYRVPGEPDALYAVNRFGITKYVLEKGNS